MEIRPRHELSPEEVDQLEERLYEFNREATGYADGRGLAFVAEEAGEIVGAAAGYTWGGICELRQVWVREDRRKSGLGSRLLERAVAEARARGCAQVLLCSYDFQAPAFYARHGFEQIAAVPDKPLGHTEFILRRRLT
jgi:N-acetylglutamate synthase-like GNAT family acetyltransferase